MDVLVTGTGFVGANVVAKFIDEGNSVIALDPNPVKPDYLEGAGKQAEDVQRERDRASTA